MITPAEQIKSRTQQILTSMSVSEDHKLAGACLIMSEALGNIRCFCIVRGDGAVDMCKRCFALYEANEALK